MTIEEAIKVIKSALCLWCVDSDKCNLCRVTEAVRYIEDMPNELQWYREQDLIHRTEMARLCKECTELAKCYVDVSLIPKAEPPFATDTNVAHKE